MKRQSDERDISAHHWSGNMRATTSSALELSHHSQWIKAVPKQPVTEFSQERNVWYTTT